MSFSFRKLLSATIGHKMLGNVSSLCRSSESSRFLFPVNHVVMLKPILSMRSFYIDFTCHAKVFIEVENDRARSCLQKNASYSSTLMNQAEISFEVKGYDMNDLLKQEWSGSTAEEVFDGFKCASVLSKGLSFDVNNPALENLFSAVIAKCREFEDSQLLGSLQFLSLWPPSESIVSNQFYSLWSAFDEACLNRVKKWDINTNLLVVDHWAHLHLARASKFVHSSLKKICRKLERLSPGQFVQLMYYINLRRKLPLSASRFEFEYTYEILMDKLTLEELSIVSMGFFKSETHLKSQQISGKILSRLESCFRNGHPPIPDDIMLASLLKALRQSVQPMQDDKLLSTLDAMLPHLNDLSPLCCLHVALIGSNIQLIHEGVMDAICRRFLAEMKNCRLKDIERLAFILTLLNYEPKTEPSIYETMVTEIRRRMAEREIDCSKWMEIDRHGECLIRFLSFLTFRQIFPLDLIDKAMDSGFIIRSYGSNQKKIGREVFVLDKCLEILFPGQIKNSLSPELREILTRELLRKRPNYAGGKRHSASDRLLLDIFENIRSLSGSEDGAYLHHILPQYERPDIVFCIGKNGEFQSISLPEHSYKPLQNCQMDSGLWHAVVVGGRNSYVKPANQPNGPLLHKMLLMEKLGYKLILVPWFEWESLGKIGKVSYLRQKIFNS